LIRGWTPLSTAKDAVGDYPGASIAFVWTAPTTYWLAQCKTWSIFKRGIVGSFHKVSRKYMPLYVAEFQLRHNNRENPDIFGTAITGC
jgi:hypothetical protein